MGPREGEPTPERFGLDGIDLVVSLVRRLFVARNFALFPTFAAAAPFRWPGRGRSLMYFVLLEVRSSLFGFGDAKHTCFPPSLRSRKPLSFAIEPELRLLLV